ncbi:MAG: sulfurtransferase-like selenium metabolism protein YedF [Lachnospiraceae bacterium]|jgi:selenium metabolism protein YedF|nr:sulfurtransferase-like selenium metabolism protein YedF [Lachnospiraceae bacterium]
MIKVNAMGDACPIPVVKTKEAIKSLNGAGEVETMVDNEIAVQNLTKMAKQKGYGVKSEKISNTEYKVIMTIGEEQAADAKNDTTEAECIVPNNGKKNRVVVISSSKMGDGDDQLGTNLMKAFIYALGQQDELPNTILFYNGGARVTCEGSLSLEDLKSMEAQGVEILTCGTCLNFYEIADKLAVGGITNMYDIVEKMESADLIIRP